MVTCVHTAVHNLRFKFAHRARGDVNSDLDVPFCTFAYN